MEATRASAALILATLGLLVLIACGPNVYEGRDGVPLNGLQISESQHGETWPLNVSGGSLECLDAQATVFHYDRETYALNDAALALNYPPVTPLQKRPSSLGREHYDLALAEGELSPNIRSYEQFLDAFQTQKVYYREFPCLEENFLGHLGPIRDLALSLC